MAICRPIINDAVAAGEGAHLCQVPAGALGVHDGELGDGALAKQGHHLADGPLGGDGDELAPPVAEGAEARGVSGSRPGVVDETASKTLSYRV